jgi:hypothetical protein
MDLATAVLQFALSASTIVMAVQAYAEEQRNGQTVDPLQIISDLAKHIEHSEQLVRVISDEPRGAA